MDAKLKALKVVDLKDILTRAAVSIPSKSNKNDLIARILASPAALDVYNAQHSPKAPDAVPGQPEKQQTQPERDEVVCLSVFLSRRAKVYSVATFRASPTTCSASAAQNTHPPSPARPQVATSPPSKPASSVAHASPSTAVALASNATSTPKSAEDEEFERRKARAARFGLPLVEPTKPSAEQIKPAKSAKLAAPLLDDPNKLAARAARFGTGQPAAAQTTTVQTNGRKRNAPPVEAADEEELEKRRKRAERFGTSVVGTKA
ncbi:uncharacterized protein B0H18DRAFT_1207035 [Fomitopsis serialis]|uniref:uncharacterized protein n=1 Tax=Fomitopsis serialis TaxID=139415 RepID=UPI002007D4C8|nr:uncharacterized protein B0H18DRAFT_1207035 [Neoantrodia serialis]KAH9935406.1 hypothetical protein B0H18DRAFT_1207035 [Neoantrodia serialis]